MIMLWFNGGMSVPTAQECCSCPQGDNLFDDKIEHGPGYPPARFFGKINMTGFGLC